MGVMGGAAQLVLLLHDSLARANMRVVRAFLFFIKIAKCMKPKKRNFHFTYTYV